MENTQRHQISPMIYLHILKGYTRIKWISWGDWLGTGFVATFNRNYKSYEEAKKYIKS